jgi:DNA-binding SARP family transcriptional activator
MNVRLLGPLEVISSGRPVDLGSPKQRALLAVLALSAGRSVAVARLVDDLWGEAAPESATKMVQVYVSQLRKRLPAPVLVTRGRGYALDAAPDQVDALRAERLLREGRAARATGDDARAARLLAEALDLWRAPALAEFSEPFAFAESRRLEELRLALREESMGARLALGRAADVAEEVAPLVASHPLRERLRRIQMLALYRSERQADAFGVYEETRRALADELGIDPSQELRDLHRRMLSQDPALDGPPTPSQVRQGYGEVDPPSGLLGREAEMGLAARVMDRAAEGGAVILVTGEPGIGKTALCRALAALTEARGRTSIMSTASEDESGLPYAPLRPPLQALATARSELLDGLPAPARTTLVALLFDDPGPGDRPDPVADAARTRLSLGALIVAAAADRGAAVIVDDLQHADEASLRLVQHLATLAGRAGILIVAAYRSGTLNPAARSICAALLERPATTEVRLGPLHRDASAALVRREAPDADDAVTEAVWQLASGQPLLTEQLASSVGRGGAGLATPRLGEIVGARLTGLGEAVVEALALAAAGGTEMSADDFRALSGLEEKQALAALDAAAAAGVVELHGSGVGFRHPVVRDALATSLPAHRLAAAHRRAADRLAASGAAPARVAHHLIAGERPREAVPWLVDAVRDAMRVGAWADALALAETALAHADGPTRSELLEQRAELRLLTGDPAAALAYADAIAAAPPERRTRLHSRLALAHLAEGRIDAAAACLGGVDSGDEGEAARLALIRGVVAWHAGDVEEARRLAERAESAILVHGTPGEMRMALNLRGLVAHSEGDWTHALRLQLAGARSAPELEAMLFDSYLCVGEFLLSEGHPYGRIVAAADDLRQLATDAGARRGLVFATTLLGEAELLAGRLAEAERWLRSAVELARDVGADSAEVLALLRLGEAQVADGRRREGARLIAEAAEAAVWAPLARHLVPLANEATVRAADGVEAALAAVDAAEAGADHSSLCVFCSVGYAAAASAACAARGRVEMAQALLARAEGAAARWRERRWAAVIGEARGALAAARGEREDATALLDEAAERFEDAGQALNAERVRGRLDGVVAAGRVTDTSGECGGPSG